MNSASKTISCAILMVSAIASSGCQGKPKAEDTPAKTTETHELTVEGHKERIRRDTLNRVGTIANDFRFIDSNGNEGTLHSLRAPHTMLIFYNPECPHCEPLLKKKASDPKVNSAIEKGELAVLAVYAEGNRDVWEKTKADMPQNWIVAYDLTGVLDLDLYDLPAMPYAFALSADKRVVIKDMPW